MCFKNSQPDDLRLAPNFYEIDPKFPSQNLYQTFPSTTECATNWANLPPYIQDSLIDKLWLYELFNFFEGFLLVTI